MRSAPSVSASSRPVPEGVSGFDGRGVVDDLDIGNVSHRLAGEAAQQGRGDREIAGRQHADAGGQRRASISA